MNTTQQTRIKKQETLICDLLNKRSNLTKKYETELNSLTNSIEFEIEYHKATLEGLN